MIAIATAHLPIFIAAFCAIGVVFLAVGVRMELDRRADRSSLLEGAYRHER